MATQWRPSEKLRRLMQQYLGTHSQGEFYSNISPCLWFKALGRLSSRELLPPRRTPNPDGCGPPQALPLSQAVATTYGAVLSQGDLNPHEHRRAARRKGNTRVIRSNRRLFCLGQCEKATAS